jgi:hypothetical protein
MPVFVSNEACTYTMLWYPIANIACRLQQVIAQFYVKLTFLTGVMYAHSSPYVTHSIIIYIGEVFRWLIINIINIYNADLIKGKGDTSFSIYYTFPP